MRNNSLQKNVFEVDANKSSCAVFKIFPDEAAHPSHPNVAISNLPRWISLSGGVLLNSSDQDPFAIPIVDYHWYVDQKKCTTPREDELPNDMFNSSFIYDAYIKGSFKDLDLNKYRVGKSIYVNYDANRILKRELSWKQLLKSRPIPVPVPVPFPVALPNLTLVKIEPGAQNQIRSRSQTSSPTPAPAPTPALPMAASSVSSSTLRSARVSRVQNENQSSIRNRNHKEREKGTVTKPRSDRVAVNPVDSAKSSKVKLPTIPTKSKTGTGSELPDPDEAVDRPDKNHSDRDRTNISSPSISIVKTEPCSPPKRACNKETPTPNMGVSSAPVPSRPEKASNLFQNRTTKISTVTSVPSTSSSSATSPSKQNQVSGCFSRSTYERERDGSPFSFPSSPSPPSSDSGRKRGPSSSYQHGFRKIERMQYTHDDGQKMLDYICQNNMHPFTRGNQIWVEMYLDKVTDHTDQSMKEHFRKKVYPRMDTAYQCSREDRKKFEHAERAVARGKRVPIYIARDR